VGGQEDVGSGVLQRPLLDHHFGPIAPLLGGLEEQRGCAGHLFSSSSQQFRQPHSQSHVAVVAAGVHPSRHPGSVLGPGLLGDRQPIHIEAKHHHRAGPASLQDADHARLCDSPPHPVPQPFQVLDDDPGGPLLLEGQLWVHVEIPPPGDQSIP